ncbi:MAG: DUF6702 family protein [Cytophagales bacterium]|nr:DUF6702 family protein [Cytophagales bacterium]
MIKSLFCYLVCLPAFVFNGPSVAHDRHPFHISVTEILHKPEEKVIQMTVRLFQDDMEQGLQEFTGNVELDILNKEDSVYLTEIIGQYVLNNLSLTTKKELTLNYLGFEYDNDVIYCYIESVKVKPFDQLTISNELLTSTFDDQENLVHVKKANKVKSLRMTSNKSLETLEWDTKK